MFDPFNDFEIAGYLRNVRKDKDETKIKHFEHDLFRANLDSALAYLSTKKVLAYPDFLEVHRILFSDYYPWAGKDRSVTIPDRAVVKGDVLFCLPTDIHSLMGMVAQCCWFILSYRIAPDFQFLGRIPARQNIWAH